MQGQCLQALHRQTPANGGFGVVDSREGLVKWQRSSQGPPYHNAYHNLQLDVACRGLLFQHNRRRIHHQRC
jgi:hypothetical protein